MFSPLVTMNSEDNNLETIDVLKCNQPEQRSVFILSDSTVVHTDNVNSKRQLSEGSSLSSPFPPLKRPNVRKVNLISTHLQILFHHQRVN